MCRGAASLLEFVLSVPRMPTFTAAGEMNDGDTDQIRNLRMAGNCSR